MTCPMLILYRALAADTFLRILEASAKAAALYTFAASQGVALKSFLAQTNTPASSLGQTDVTPMPSLKSDMGHHNTSTTDNPPSLHTVLQFIRESKGSISLDTVSQLVERFGKQAIALFIAEAASDARLQVGIHNIRDVA
jgi:hypothetical protein